MIQHSAGIVHGGEFVDLHLTGSSIDLDFRDLRGEGSDRRARRFIDAEMRERLAVLFERENDHVAE